MTSYLAISILIFWYILPHFFKVIYNSFKQFNETDNSPQIGTYRLTYCFVCDMSLLKLNKNYNYKMSNTPHLLATKNYNYFKMQYTVQKTTVNNVDIAHLQKPITRLRKKKNNSGSTYQNRKYFICNTWKSTKAKLIRARTAAKHFH